MSNMPIRIAQIIGRTINGGVENLILNFYKHIDRTKVTFDFLVEQESLIINREEIEALGGKVIIIPSIKSTKKYIRELTNIFKENRYDIVQANINSLSLFPLKAAKKAGIKIRICNSLSTSNKKECIRNIIKNVLKPFSKKYSTKYFACSNLCGEWLYGKNIINNENYYLIHNAVNVEKYKYNESYSNELRVKHELGNKFVIGTIGRLEKQKNHSFLLEVFSRYHSIDTESILIIIGDGKLQSELEEKISKYGLQNDVLILTSDKVGVGKNAAKYYSVFDCFVLPSLYEGLPTVGIEAQLNNLPCVLSDTITRETSIKNNVTYVSLDCIDEWISAISHFKEENIQRNAHEEHKEYDMSYESERVLLLYQKFMEEE